MTVLLCPGCEQEITDPITHAMVCHIDPNRLAMIGLLTKEQVKIVKDSKGQTHKRYKK